MVASTCTLYVYDEDLKEGYARFDPPPPFEEDAPSVVVDPLPYFCTESTTYRASENAIFGELESLPEIGGPIYDDQCLFEGGFSGPSSGAQARNQYQAVDIPYAKQLVKWFINQLQKCAHRVTSTPQGCQALHPRYTAPISDQAAAHLSLNTRSSREDFEHLAGNCNVASWDIPNPHKQQGNKRKREASPSGKTYACDKCDYISNDQSNFRRHQKTSKLHGAPPLTCLFCNKTDGLQRPDHLKAHVKKMHNYDMTGRNGFYTFTSTQDGTIIKTVKGLLEKL